MRAALLLTAAFARHWYADCRGTNLCMVVLLLSDIVVVVVVKIVDLIAVVVDGRLIVVCVVRRIVVMTIDDALARLADSQVAWLAEEFP